RRADAAAHFFLPPGVPYTSPRPDRPRSCPHRVFALVRSDFENEQSKGQRVPCSPEDNAPLCPSPSSPACGGLCLTALALVGMEGASRCFLEERCARFLTLDCHGSAPLERGPA